MLASTDSNDVPKLPLSLNRAQGTLHGWVVTDLRIHKTPEIRRVEGLWPRFSDAKTCGALNGLKGLERMRRP